MKVRTLVLLGLVLVQGACKSIDKEKLSQLVAETENSRNSITSSDSLTTEFLDKLYEYELHFMNLLYFLDANSSKASKLKDTKELEMICSQVILDNTTLQSVQDLCVALPFKVCPDLFYRYEDVLKSAKDILYMETDIALNGCGS